MNDLIETLRLKLPEHTFKATMNRIENESRSDDEKRERLERALAGRERSEAWDREQADQNG